MRRREFQVTGGGSTRVGKTGERLRFEFLEFCEKILATCYFATVFESDEIRLAGCARHACDLVDKVTGRFYFGSVGVPFSVQEAKGTRDLVSGTVADKLRFFEVAHLFDQCFDFLLLNCGTLGIKGGRRRK